MDRPTASLTAAALALAVTLVLTGCNGLPTGATYTAGKTPAALVTPTPAPCKGNVCPIR